MKPKKGGSAVFDLRNLDARPKFNAFQVKYLKIANFTEDRFHSDLMSYLVLASGQKLKKSLEPYFRKI